jgi:hypothetical protein
VVEQFSVTLRRVLFGEAVELTFLACFFEAEILAAAHFETSSDGLRLDMVAAHI